MRVALNPWSGTFRLEPDPHVQEVPADSVPAETRRKAAEALLAARAELELGDDVQIAWFADERETSKRLRAKHGAQALPWRVLQLDPTASGCTVGRAPELLWINATLTPDDAVLIVLEEAKHSAQFRDFAAGVPGALNMSGESPLADELAEVDARAWAREMAATLAEEEQHFENARLADDAPSARQARGQQLWERKYAPLHRAEQARIAELRARPSWRS